MILRNKISNFFKLLFFISFTYNFFGSEHLYVKIATNDFQACIKKINEISDDKTLLVLDFNDVLVTYDRLFYYSHYLHNEQIFGKFFPLSALNPRLVTDILDIKPGWKDILENLSKKGTKSIALSSFGVLNQKIINFKLSTLKKTGLQFDKLIPNIENQQVYFVDGTLLAIARQKCNVILDFLKYYYNNVPSHIQFNKIIVVDDQNYDINNFKNVESSFTGLNLDLYLIELRTMYDFFEQSLKKVFGNNKCLFSKYKDFLLENPTATDGEFFAMERLKIINLRRHRSVSLKKLQEINEEEEIKEPEEQDLSQRRTMIRKSIIFFPEAPEIVEEPQPDIIPIDEDHEE